MATKKQIRDISAVKSAAGKFAGAATTSDVSNSLGLALLKTDAGKTLAMDTAWKLREIQLQKLARYQELRELAYDLFCVRVNRPYIFEAAKPMLADMAKDCPDSDILAQNLRHGSSSTRAYLDAVTFLTGADEDQVSLPVCVVREANRR